MILTFWIIFNKWVLEVKKRLNSRKSGTVSNNAGSAYDGISPTGFAIQSHTNTSRKSYPNLHMRLWKIENKLIFKPKLVLVKWNGKWRAGQRANPCSECDNFIVARQRIGMHSWNGDKMIANQIPHDSVKKSKSHCIESTDRMISANRQLSTHFSSTTKGSLRFSIQFSEYITSPPFPSHEWCCHSLKGALKVHSESQWSMKYRDRLNSFFQVCVYICPALPGWCFAKQKKLFIRSLYRAPCLQSHPWDRRKVPL